MASVQGFWDSAVVGTSRTNAVIMPDGQAWVVQESGGIVTGVANVRLALDATTFANTGQYFRIPNGAAQDYRLSVSLPSGPRRDLLTTIGVGAGAAATDTWTYNSSYETAVLKLTCRRAGSGVSMRSLCSGTSMPAATWLVPVPPVAPTAAR